MALRLVAGTASVAMVATSFFLNLFGFESILHGSWNKASTGEVDVPLGGRCAVLGAASFGVSRLLAGVLANVVETVETMLTHDLLSVVSARVHVLGGAALCLIGVVERHYVHGHGRCLFILRCGSADLRAHDGLRWLSGFLVWGLAGMEAPSGFSSICADPQAM